MDILLSLSQDITHCDIKPENVLVEVNKDRHITGVKVRRATLSLSERKILRARTLC